MKPGEVHLEEEGMFSCCGMLRAALGQGHSLTDPLTGQQVAYPQLQKHRQLSADILVHCRSQTGGDSLYLVMSMKSEWGMRVTYCT